MGEKSILEKGLEKYFSTDQLKKLSNTVVGIAGLGGLGSNVALMLARSGISHFVLIDHDIIEESNLNRQQFWPNHVGKYKVDALSEILTNLNPNIKINSHILRITKDNLKEIIHLSNIWVEALDNAEIKTIFMEQTAKKSTFLTGASGIAGYGKNPINRKILGNIVIVGDFITDTSIAPPLAPRVTEAAALMADSVLTYILKGKISV